LYMTFNGVSSADFGIAVLSKSRQLFPGSNDSYTVVPGRNGTYLFSGGLQDREIKVKCTYTGTSAANIRANARLIAAWLYSAERKVLTFSDEPDLYYIAKVSSSLDPKHFSLMETFEIIFNCEPLAYGAEVTTNFTADTATVNNAGTYKTQPTFNATFTAVASEFKVALGAEYIRVVNDFAVDDILQINTETGAVLINDSRAMDKLDWQNSNWFTLAPDNNALSIAPTGKCTANVKHTPRWL